MAKKVIRLNEQDVERLVRKIIKEDTSVGDMYNEINEVFIDSINDDLYNYSHEFDVPEESGDIAKLIMDGIYTELTLEEDFGDGMVSFTEDDFKRNWDTLMYMFKRNIPQMIENL